MKDVKQLARRTAGTKAKLSSHLPPTFVDCLVFPLPWIADSRFCLHIVEPDVFGSRPIGPHILAGNAAGMATDTLVQV